jgi:hypothetical protein
VRDEPDSPSVSPVERPVVRAPRPGSAPTIAAGPDATDLMRMDRARCHAWLDEHEVAYAAVAPRDAPEVAIPVRLTGPLAGVAFVIPWSDDPARDPHAIWDCRLVAAMLPVAGFLHAHGVVEAQYFSALRRGKIVRDKPHSQHNLGLALDLYGVRGPGPLATVEGTYPRRRLRTCPDGPGHGAVGGPVAAGSEAADMWLALVCQAYARGLFHTILTPDHDRAHANHLHLDLKAGQRAPADPYLSVDGR